MSLFGRPKRDEARSKAKAEYEAACAADVATRTGHALVVRAGARAKVHVDKVFVAGAEKAEAYDEAAQVAIVLGQEKPELPKVSEYQVIKAVNGDIVSFLPLPYCERIFRLGMRYQTMEIPAEQAIELVQQLADQISLELQLEKPFVALEFLREELKSAQGDSASASPEES